MELKMNSYQLPSSVSFNYDELKAALTEKVAEYKTIVYTDDTIRNAKDDRAALNKLSKALNDERISLQKEYMKPFDEFKAKIDELISIIKEPTALIDSKVKEYEERKKQEKRKAIEELFATIGFAPFVQIEAVFRSSWLNASVSMSAIEKDMQSLSNSITEDIKTVESLEYPFEAMEVYKTSLDLRQAINESNRVAYVTKLKAEEEEKRRAAQEEKARIEAEVKASEPEPVPEASPVKTAEESKAEPKRVALTFTIMVTLDEANMVKEFFKSNKIEYRRA